MTTKNKKKATNEVIVAGFKLIEKAVVTGYQKIEDGVVTGYTKIEDIFIDAFLKKEYETIEEAKNRLREEIKKRQSSGNYKHK